MGMTSSPTAAEVLVHGLRGLVDVVYAPMPHAVARLDVAPHGWVLYLDSDSPAEDHCWAMVDALKFLALGPGEAEWAVPVPRLHLVR